MDELTPYYPEPPADSEPAVDQGPASLSGRRWRIRAVGGPHHRRAAEQCGLPDGLACLLASRRLDSADQAEDFLNPRLNQLLDPSQILDMDRATARLVEAIRGEESIAVFGDYDVDGATASALLTRYFRALGRPARIYVPDRMREGYGPNPTAMETLHAEGIRVVVTVDCGIAAFDALERARELEMTVIVTDHHQVVERGLPPAFAVIDPNRPDDPFPHKELAGVGLAFYLAISLNRALRQAGWFTDQRPEPDLKTFLDLVAVGSVADVAPLTGLNRPLVAAGLRVALNSGNVGLQALMRRAGLPKPDADGVTPGQVGFQIGPRINAGGRLHQGILGAELLTAEAIEKAEEIAGILEAANRERQGIEQQILEQALEQVAEQGLEERRLGWVLAHPEWHPGVVGIVASRIAERFHRPVFVVALNADKGEGRGSGRSIPGLNLFDALQAAGSLLIQFGGHQAAAGLTIDAERLAAFTEAFDQAVRSQNPPETFQPQLVVDGPVGLGQDRYELHRQVQRFQPFGRGNPEPVFVLERMRLEQPRLLKERHVKGRLVDAEGRALEAIGFGLSPGPLGEGLMAADGRLLDVAGTLSLNRFQGRETLQLQIKDARFSNGPG